MKTIDVADKDYQFWNWLIKISGIPVKELKEIINDDIEKKVLEKIEDPRQFITARLDKISQN